MKHLLIAALLLASCAMPDTYGITGGYGQGNIDHDNNTSADYDTDQWIGLLTVGWSPGDTRRHQESLAATRRLEIATVTGKVQPIVVEQPDKEESDDSVIGVLMPDIPDTEEESWNLVRWAGAIVLLAVSFFIYRKAGGSLPFAAKKEPE